MEFDDLLQKQEDVKGISFKQFLIRQSQVITTLKDPAVSLSEKLYLLEHVDNDILPLTVIQRIALFNSFAENSTVKTTLINLHYYTAKKEGASITWASLKDGISELLQEEALVSDNSRKGLAVKRNPPRKSQLLQPNIRCYKCDGKGHKLSVCPSRT
ncbi:uncharacterized protein AC631_05690 [Debaryomyces fabryi]|uniref:CCHC-type domain-containing protein n=1 Tax=Debaryomyces fabryi TaxID=58627 RepID=A0A0V1PQV1_9ASCO|nr:uncharacterized protein AC631_05690 [Debaryomyces fabryi]KRZ98545.1 hypothetical protein AC631_05690 [Debaryomyces fabryi]CUM46554.1 unnamed protein product [Debaryomyces fabryi]